ncbi:MAG: fibronectin type III domain-containing protein, partial [Candidatus Omnitrophica bacterium]|nr:fibronectin type III domain-containing protein [Candidatus Omnitrophota bacterium]
MFGQRARGYLPPFVFLACLCLSAAAAPAQDQGEDPARVPTRIVLTWSGDPSTTQAVTWRTEEEVPDPRAQIALLAGDPKSVESATPVMATSQQIITEGSATAWYHSVTFQGLKPKTDYCYRVGSDSAWSE